MQLRTITIISLIVFVAAIACEEDIATDNPSEDSVLLDAETSIQQSDDELLSELAILDKILTDNPNDPIALARVEVLNQEADTKAGLFQTIEISEGHVIKLFELSDGSRVIEELLPIGHDQVLEGASLDTFESVYRHLRPEQEVPAKILEADTRIAATDSDENVVSDEVVD
ncbi:MAG: hypothetical protein GY847_25760, partial [Proteobacteria bacterium]|nr:hypothetical protein [Pseudomonadota bacterium]